MSVGPAACVKILQKKVSLTILISVYLRIHQYSIKLECEVEKLVMTDQDMSSSHKKKVQNNL